MVVGGGCNKANNHKERCKGTTCLYRTIYFLTAINSLFHKEMYLNFIPTHSFSCKHCSQGLSGPDDFGGKKPDFQVGRSADVFPKAFQRASNVTFGWCLGREKENQPKSEVHFSPSRMATLTALPNTDNTHPPTHTHHTHTLLAFLMAE